MSKFLTVEEFSAALAKIQRERLVIKASLVREDVKARLLEQLAVKEAELELEPGPGEQSSRGASIAPPGAGQAPSRGK